ncbi:glycosyltransferase family 4 protein [Vibrio kanaloae]|uniref:glycosyltransferase family 4 protein n=1 Tax=Vibrio kanaloae TaxID=170673 RepID=UPI001EFDB9D4|nr:glycosyltransferase family 4 protein [Vibrio kanaloae]MCG9557809.1 glycosyltransferase family 4 protein [Vibrio kanaloae]
MSTIKPNQLNTTILTSAQQQLALEHDEIWLLIDSQTFGGIETHVIELAIGLIEHKQKVRVVLLTKFNPPPPIITRLNQLQLPYCHLCELAPNSQNALSQLKQAITEYQPSFIHAHGYKASIVSKIIKLTTTPNKLRQISTYHAGEKPRGKVWLYDFIDRYSGFISNRSLVVSDKIRDKIPTKTTLLNNFISIPEQSCSSCKSNSAEHCVLEENTTTYDIGFVGRLSHEKAADRFVMLARSNPNQQFHIFGDGPERQSLECNQPANLTFHGHQTSMEKAWQTIDVLVVPSRYEGLPMAALEAMARRIPVIATAVGNLPQLIEHQTNGYLAQSEAELHTCLQNWINLPLQDKSTVGDKARSTIIERYSPQAVIPQILKCYSS